ncbi:hypothetical protein I3843_04G149000 [Carya illinoinensis]|uniref:RNase H type-1 domain-containing protein n=1 Tax=Carya illinoinensis TaxID=32201 RepID=A0A922F9J5_CARIL|nr:hypothetical protein I3760_04G157500 [Carya illinoinensis]KAG6718588.1 hypothetical protein I3842_04G159100 [Carya illinoinensis]KAG7984235.1 hypothetical protein I3843_04G149000 [Carya illinoinensis]
MHERREPFKPTNQPKIIANDNIVSLSIHLLAVIQMPKLILAKINSILSNSFFSGEENGRNRRKLKSWTELCTPTMKGGLGVRDFVEVQKALHMKFAWRLLSLDNLWTSFFKAKYLKEGHFFETTSRNSGSMFWKSICSVMPMVKEHMVVKVQKGAVSFLFDLWLSRGVLATEVSIVNQPRLEVKDCWVEGRWDREFLDSLIASDVGDDIIREVPGRREGCDTQIWCPGVDGQFTTKTAWEVIRVTQPNGGVEDRDHVLCKGMVASAIWCRATDLLSVPCMAFDDWWERCKMWFTCAKKKMQRGVLIGIMPTLISWRLWKWRCDAQMQGRYDSMEVIWFSIKYWLVVFLSKLLKVKALSSFDRKLLSELDIPVREVVPRILKLVAWSMPSDGWVKLNVDGSCRGNLGSCGGGGVIRDEGGRFLATFSSKYGIGTNNEAELKALIGGLTLCKELGLVNLVIESDSMLVVKWLREKMCTVWYLWDYWEEVVQVLTGTEYLVLHQFREGNRVADFLARQGE